MRAFKTLTTVILNSLSDNFKAYLIPGSGADACFVSSNNFFLPFSIPNNFFEIYSVLDNKS